MGSRIKKKAIPLIATTVLATTAFTTQSFVNDGKSKSRSKRIFKGRIKTKTIQLG